MSVFPLPNVSSLNDATGHHTFFQADGPDKNITLGTTGKSESTKKSGKKKTKKKSAAQIRRETEVLIFSTLGSIYQDYCSSSHGNFATAPWEPFLRDLLQKRKDKKPISKLTILNGSMAGGTSDTEKSAGKKGSKSKKSSKASSSSKSTTAKKDKTDKQSGKGSKKSPVTASSTMPIIPGSASKVFNQDSISAIFHSLSISAMTISPNPIIQSLTSLVLAGAGLSVTSLISLFRFVPLAVSLAHLDLSKCFLHNIVDRTSYAILLEDFRCALQKSNSLVSLVLDFNRLDDARLVKCLFQGLEANLLQDRKKPFHNLSMKYCGLKELSSEMLPWLDNEKCKIKTLDLTGNKLGLPFLKKLFATHVIPESVERLALVGNITQYPKKDKADSHGNLANIIINAFNDPKSSNSPIGSHLSSIPETKQDTLVDSPLTTTLTATVNSPLKLLDLRGNFMSRTDSASLASWASARNSDGCVGPILYLPENCVSTTVIKDTLKLNRIFTKRQKQKGSKRK